MVDEVQKQILTTAKPTEPIVQQFLHFNLGRRGRVAIVRFHVTVAIFLGIDLWRIRWQPLNNDFWMLRQVCLDLITSVNLGAVPNQNPLAFDPSPEMSESDDYAVTIDRFVKMAFVNFA